MSTVSAPATARARARATLTEDIKREARTQLAEHGTDLSLRAVARALGMASSAVYRYFASRDDLLTALIVDAYDAVGAAAEEAVADVGPGVEAQWLALCGAVRGWAVAHPHDYALVYGSPVPGYRAPEATIAPAARVSLVALGIVRDGVASGEISVEGAVVVPSAVRSDLVGLSAQADLDVPEHVLARGLMVWMQVFGTISFELFGHLHNVIHDYDAFFESQMRGAARFLILGGWSLELTRLARTFRAAHRPSQPLLLANAWDIGSARFLAGLGFAALATTSSGFAATLGRRDYRVTRDEALAHAAALAGATDVPVSADLENCFAHGPSGVADTIEEAKATGLAGGSVEDFTGDANDPIYAIEHATERVAAAAEAAHRGDDFVLTARAENFLHGRPDLADTIARLQRYQEAGADVLYAPALTALPDIRSVVSSLDKPINVLTVPGLPTVSDLASVGVARISVGGAFAFVALGAVARAGRELLEQGTYGWFEVAGDARPVVARSFES